MKHQPGHHVRLAGTGSFLPGDPIPMNDIEKVLGDFEDVDDDFKKWYKRTRKVMRGLLGVDYYYFAIDPETGETTETPSSMAAKAAENALEMAGIKANDVDLLLYGGASQDLWACPPTTSFIQEKLGIEHCAEMSIHSNCTSTYKAIQIATDQIAYGRYKTALVTTANQTSHYYRASSFNQKKMTRHQAMMRWFLCDGGGAMVLTRDDGSSPGLEVYDTMVESVGIAHEPHMYTRFGSCQTPKEAWDEGLHHLTQNFNQVSTIGPDFFLDGVQRFAEQVGLNPDDPENINMIKYFLANVPADHLLDVAMEEAKERISVGMRALQKVYYSTVANRGYTGPAAIAITLDELMRKKRGDLSDGDFLVSFVTESSKWMNAGFVMRYRA